MLPNISVSILEKFRRFLYEVSGSDTEKNLVTMLEGKVKRTPAMRIGSACHNIVDNPSSTDTTMGNGKYWTVSENIAIPADQAEKLTKYKAAYPGIVTEVPVGKQYATTHGPVVVSARLDGILGMLIRDLKFFFGFELDPQEYMDSYQWRFYCDMLEVYALYYDVFEVRHFKKLLKSPEGIEYPDKFTLYRHEPIGCHAYDGMQGDLTNLLNEFMTWITAKRLTHLLKQTDCARKPVRLKS